uniref:Uncharacterized protein n=1 Tax=Amphimedon queenslandica TaxID=400682 RepID=A0A1X7SGY3_AMPQE
DVFLRVLDIILKQQLMIDESIANVTKVLNFLHNYELFETNKSHADELPCSKLMSVIQEYLVSNLLNNKEHIFSPLIAIAAHYPTLISKALSLAKKLVEEHESKTCRQDDLLWKPLKKLEEAVTVPRNKFNKT